MPADMVNLDDLRVNCTTIRCSWWTRPVDRPGPSTHPDRPIRLVFRSKIAGSPYVDPESAMMRSRVRRPIRLMAGLLST